MDEIQLKSCPFCGSTPRLAKDMDEDLWSHNIVEWQQVKCTECECEGIRSCEGFEVDAVTMWNTRAPQWLPIESAPKTTRSILVWCPERQNQYLVYWDRLDAGEWRTVGGCKVLTEVPTHWRPLPAPPEGAA